MDAPGMLGGPSKRIGEQHFWNNVEKDQLGAPVRDRVGERVFAREEDGTYVQIE